MQYQNEKEFEKLLKVFQGLDRKMYILEIGSLLGETLKYWIDYCDNGATIISVDMLVSQQDGRYKAQKFGHMEQWYAWALDKCNLSIIETNSVIGETIIKVAKTVPELDFLFIDGGHDELTVFNDFNNYKSLVRSGGVIAFHDIAKYHPGSKARVVWDLVKNNYRHEEFVEDDNNFGIGVLYVS